MRRLAKVGSLTFVVVLALVCAAAVSALATTPAHAEGVWMCPIGNGPPAFCPVIYLPHGGWCVPVGCDESENGGCEYLCYLG